MAEKKNEQGLPIGKPLTQDEYFKAINEARNTEDVSDEEQYNALLEKGLDELNADEVKFVAKYLNIKYTNKDETLEAIKTTQEEPKK